MKNDRRRPVAMREFRVLGWSLITVAILLVLFLFSGCSNQVCRCTSDTECQELCGGFGDPTSTP